MATILIRNASVFSPDPLGTSDILIINDRIAAIAQNISIPEWLDPVQQMDGKGLFAVPGFIDAHVHITGGGGYLYMVAKDPQAAGQIRRILTEHAPNPRARFVDMTLSDKGLQVSRS